MGAFTQLADVLVNTGFTLYISLVWMRFLLQLVGADFYNPYSQFVVKATKPLLHPMRRLVPSVAGMDTAALLLILLLKLAQVGIEGYLLVGAFIPPVALLMTSIFALAGNLISFYLVAIIIAVIASWVAPPGSTPASLLLYQIVEPAMGPLRRLLPSAGGLDFSPMVAMLLLQIAGYFLKLAIIMAAPLLQGWGMYTLLASRPLFGYLGG